ncbi:hypothetical protein ACPYO6_01460 [Georgenia sp. Z1344]|uniref:hypothetical protein n=1 Tax=Georgenia sp. Z1344 TaxID=3416706 RepID=UPI003CEB68F9
MHARRTAPLVVVGLVVAALAACGDEPELTEAEACAEYDRIVSDIEATNPTFLDPNQVMQPDLMDEYGKQMADLADRAPGDLADLFDDEAEFAETLLDGSEVDEDTFPDHLATENAIHAACGTASGADAS